MKIALQLGLIPGQSTADKAKWAKAHGVEGIEVSAFSGGLEVMRRQADEINGIVPICSVCGNADKNGDSAFNFLHPDKAKRQASIDGRRRTDRAADFRGAGGARFVAIHDAAPA